MHAWEQIQQTLDEIEDHLSEEINIEDLAKKASLSIFYYQRLFRRLVKKPVAEYVKLRRMARAAELLLEKERRILDIALELGFSSHEHFTRTFKETFGVTPDEYRRHPQTFNRMNKPELLLHYTVVDENVPLITGGIVLEICRRNLDEPLYYAGIDKKMPVGFIEGLGVESGTDPLYELWETVHEQKNCFMQLSDRGEEIGVTHPCSEEGYFNYFAGARIQDSSGPDGFPVWTLPKGEYIVCSFEAESFEDLVMDALYKAEQYLFGVWLPTHQIQTEPFCAERYKSHSPKTTSMEVWLKLRENHL